MKKLSDVYTVGDVVSVKSNLAHKLGLPSATGHIKTVPNGVVDDRAVVYVSFGAKTVPLSLNSIDSHIKKRNESTKMKTYSQLINEISKNNDDMDDSVNDEKLKDNTKKATVKTKHPVATDDQFDGGVSKDKSRKADVKEELDEIKEGATSYKGTSADELRSNFPGLLGPDFAKKVTNPEDIVKMMELKDKKAEAFNRYIMPIEKEIGKLRKKYRLSESVDMEEGKLPPHLAKFVNKKGDFTDDVKKRLGKDGEERLLGKKEKKTVKEASSPKKPMSMKDLENSDEYKEFQKNKGKKPSSHFQAIKKTLKK